jgi:hypothetical protein
MRGWVSLLLLVILRPALSRPLLLLLLVHLLLHTNLNR